MRTRAALCECCEEMSFIPTPGRDEHRPYFPGGFMSARDHIDDALMGIELETRRAELATDGVPLIEETLSPVEVHTSFGQEYACVPRHVWIETCQRALGNQIRADRLQDEINGLRLQIDAHEVVGAAKDREADDLDEAIKKLEGRLTKAAAKMAVLRADRDWWRRFGLAAVAVATIAGTVACVLAAKIAGLW